MFCGAKKHVNLPYLMVGEQCVFFRIHSAVFLTLFKKERKNCITVFLPRLLVCVFLTNQALEFYPFLKWIATLHEWYRDKHRKSMAGMPWKKEEKKERRRRKEEKKGKRKRKNQINAIVYITKQMIVGGIKNQTRIAAESSVNVPHKGQCLKPPTEIRCQNIFRKPPLKIIFRVNWEFPGINKISYALFRYLPVTTRGKGKGSGRGEGYLDAAASLPPCMRVPNWPEGKRRLMFRTEC